MGGILNGTGSARFDNFEIFINGEKYTDVKPKKTEPTKKQTEWLKDNIYSLKTYDETEKSDEDLSVLGQLIGNNTVVASGEVTHGSSEIFRMKHRIIKYLSQHKGFDVFSIEANMPEAYKVNRYIIEGKGDPREVLKGMYFWTWNTTGMLGLINWMKEYNSSQKKIQYTGFDMQYYMGAVENLRSALKNNPEAVKLVNLLQSKLDKNRERIKK